MLNYIAGFILGVIITSSICYVLYVRKLSGLNNELLSLKLKTENEPQLLESLKHWCQSAMIETLTVERDDIRKQNAVCIEDKLRPLAEKLTEFHNKIDKFNILEAENTTKIVEQINLLEKNNKAIENETKNLIEALTLNKNVKGEYGENMLENILHVSGMREGIHYTKQFVTTSVNLSDNQTHTVRPDFVINLPNDNKLIIDSKLTLSSYLKFVENPESYKDLKLEIKKRISELSNKNYQNAEGIDSVDFVMMYVPIESCLNVIYQDFELVDYAYNSNVIIVGTTSLLTSLRLASYLIAQKTQQDNINQIVSAGTNLYETFSKFCNELIDLQKKFDGLSAQFNKTINRFRRNNVNQPSLFSQIEELKNFGIHTSKKIPEEFLNNYVDTEEEVPLNE